MPDDPTVRRRKAAETTAAQGSSIAKESPDVDAPAARDRGRFRRIGNDNETVVDGLQGRLAGGGDDESDPSLVLRQQRR